MVESPFKYDNYLFKLFCGHDLHWPEVDPAAERPALPTEVDTDNKLPDGFRRIWVCCDCGNSGVHVHHDYCAGCGGGAWKFGGYSITPEVEERMSQAGKKWDDGKAPLYQGLFQYFPDALNAVSQDSRYGKVKYDLTYDDINWMRVEEGFNKYSDAMLRHVANEFKEGPWDLEAQELGFDILHATMVAWNSLARLQLLITELKARGEWKDAKHNQLKKKEDG